MDWAAVWMDVFGGLLIAGALAAWVPNSFWQGLFLQHHGALATIWGPLIGPLVAMLSFVCSIGNVPLAAVLWNGGISFGGVLAFIFADLIILPILNIYRKYYGRRMAAFLLVTFYATMAAAGLIVDLIFKVARPRADRRAARQRHRRRRELELHDGAEHRLPAARRGARRALLPQGRRPRDAADDERAHRRAPRPRPARGRRTPALRRIPMGERGSQLLETADRQISRLIGLVSRVDETVLRLPCPGREKLGDGTVGALASHTADSYLRIAAFLQTTNEPSPARPGSDRVARLLSARSHTPPRHADSGHNDITDDRAYKAENVGLPGLIERLSTGREALSLLADLSDDQLDTMPPAGSFRFCDGHRTLEQVVSSLLKHQGHQIDVINSAVT